MTALVGRRESTDPNGAAVDAGWGWAPAHLRQRGGRSTGSGHR